MIAIACVLALLAALSYAETDCGSITVSEECTHDASHCEWNDVYHTCVHVNGSASCNTIMNQPACIGLGCQFDMNTHSCHAKGEKPLCSRAGSADMCSEHAHCVWNDDVKLCLAPGQAPKCEHVYVQDGCLSIAGCAWSETYHSCYTESIGIACPIHPGEKCLTYPNCQWFESAHRCLPKGSKLHCEMLYNEIPCHEHSHCQWHKVGQMCLRKDAPIPCYKHNREDMCVKDPACQYEPASFSCHKKGTKVPCDRFYARDHCSSRTDCRWDADAFLCKVAGSKTPCNRYVDPKACENAGCQLHGRACLEPGLRPECSSLTTMHKCMSAGCLWQDNECNDPPETDINATPAAEFADQHVNNLNGANYYNPNPSRDSLLDQHGHLTLDCSKITCPKIVCLPHERAVLRKGMCCTECSGTQEYCSQFDVVYKCPYKCLWHSDEQYCAALDTYPPCELTTRQMPCLSHNCSWSTEHSACYDTDGQISCTALRTKTDCAAFTHCQYNDDAEKCTKPDTQFSCRNYTTAGCKKHSECELDSTQTLCQTIGETIECIHYNDPKTCKATGRCYHDEPTNTCQLKGTRPPCHHFKEMMMCSRRPECEFDHLLSKCFDKAHFELLDCEQHYSEDDCLPENGCAWFSQVYACVPQDTRPPCKRLYGKEYCFMNQACVWHENSESCLEIGETVACDRIYNPIGCGKHDCEWDEGAVLCKTKGDKTPCHRYYDRGVCHSHDCHYNDAELYCYDPLLPLPCNRLHDHDNCTKNGCVYISGTYQCMEESELKDCGRFALEHACVAASKMCRWETDAHLCLGKSEKLTCLKIHNRGGCVSTPGCGWDHKRQRCRKLRSRDEL